MHMSDTKKTVGVEDKEKGEKEREREGGRKYQPRFSSNIMFKYASMITMYKVKDTFVDMTPTIWLIINLVEMKLCYV